MDINLYTIFTTGLFVGGLTCLAVQGGLLTSVLAQRESAFAKASTDKEEKVKGVLLKSGQALPILSFLVAKLLAYTLLGLLLGWLGSLISFSVQMQIALQLAVVFFMLGTAMNLLNVHPIFRYFVIQPPRLLTRLIRKQSKRKDVFAPALLGAFTIFIPCGTTQAMMALAIASGNPLIGALILFTFILGTSPVFFILGYFTMKLGEVLHKHFMRVAAIALILLALFNLDGALSLAGFTYTPTRIFREVFCLVSYCPITTGTLPEAVTEQTITISDSGYTPQSFAVQRGSEVTIKLINNGAFNCAQAFTIPALNIQEIVAPNQTKEVVFTAPEKPGTLAFMCSMGMYTGRIEVL